MKVIDIKQVKCTLLGSASGFRDKKYIQKDVFLSEIMGVCVRSKPAVDFVRQYEYHSPSYDAAKAKLPCWIAGGTFPYKKVGDESILTYTNLIVVDIDKKDNPEIDLNELKSRIFELPYVVWVMNSVSGLGFFVVMLVDDGRYTSEYLNYIDKLWKQEYGVEIDRKCFNVGRKRFISYDDNMLIKDDDVDIIPWKLKMKITAPSQPQTWVDCSRYKHDDADLDKEFEKKVDIMIKYHYDVGMHWADWASLGKAFKPFSNGFEMFDKLSRTMTAYDPKTIKGDWKRFRGSIQDKSHAIAYITKILNSECPGWKDDYYRTTDELPLFNVDQPPV